VRKDVLQCEVAHTNECYVDSRRAIAINFLIPASENTSRPFYTGGLQLPRADATSRQPVTGVTEQTNQACQAISCGIVCPQSCADRFRAAGSCEARPVLQRGAEYESNPINDAASIRTQIGECGNCRSSQRSSELRSPDGIRSYQRLGRGIVEAGCARRVSRNVAGDDDAKSLSPQECGCLCGCGQRVGILRQLFLEDAETCLQSRPFRSA
jgi:hypothetical protein